jgi:hypothetical protein
MVAVRVALYLVLLSVVALRERARALFRRALLSPR